MPQKGNLAVFESSNILKTGEVTPTKIGAHELDINNHYPLSTLNIIMVIVNKTLHFTKIEIYGVI